MDKINMVDVKSQYDKIKSEIDAGIQEVINSTSFINGPAVKRFAKNLGNYLGTEHVIPCGNGTDALQIAMMALDLKPGDEVIVPAFTYVATAEVIALLGLKPVMVDVSPDSFNMTADVFLGALSPKTKAVVPVNLYGQCAELEQIMEIAESHSVYVIEDNAQAIGADYIKSDGSKVKAGLIGHIGTTSFYPSKNLGAYGDGGAIYTKDADLAAKMKMVANHGQTKKYVHDIIGCNSRLDSIQAAILDVKLKYLDQYCSARQSVAKSYNKHFEKLEDVKIPEEMPYSTHVYHQYTLKVTDGRRDALKSFLAENNIPSMIYYPIPLYKQAAFNQFTEINFLPETEILCQEVISLPIHTEMNQDTIDYIADKVKTFFN